MPKPVPALLLTSARLADLMEQHQEELATIEALDAGAVYTLALKTHVGMSIQTFRYFAGWCDKIQVGFGLSSPCVHVRGCTGGFQGRWWEGWRPAKHAAKQLPRWRLTARATHNSARLGQFRARASQYAPAFCHCKKYLESQLVK